MMGFWNDIARKLAGGRRTDASKGVLGSLPKSSDAHVIVGLDFGTSGSKVVVRDAMRQREYPLAFDFGTPPELGFSRFVFPSTVAVQNGKMFFGWEAEYAASSTDHVFRSLKRTFLNISSSPTVQPQVTLEPTLAKLAKSQKADEFLATAYLAEILRQTWSALSGQWNGFSADEAIVYLDVPVATLGGSGAVRTFRRILRTAREMSTRMPASPTVDIAGELWLGTMSSLPKWPPLEERREDLVPEAVAAIGGLGEVARRQAVRSNFVVVDVGAGTTDIGFFRYPKRDARRAVFYSAETNVVGCDDIDRAICRMLGYDNPSLEQLANVRVGKTRIGVGPPPTIGDAELAAEHVREAVGIVEGPSRRAWEAAFGAAYRKDKVEAHWPALDVFVIGGGSLVDGIRSVYGSPPRRCVRSVNERKIERNLDLGCTGATTKAPEAADLVFLLTALGLSLPRALRPEMVHPQDVPDYVASGSGATGLYDFDADDMYSG